MHFHSRWPCVNYSQRFNMSDPLIHKQPFQWFTVFLCAESVITGPGLICSELLWLNDLYFTTCNSLTLKHCDFIICILIKSETLRGPRAGLYTDLHSLQLNFQPPSGFFFLNIIHSGSGIWNKQTERDSLSFLTKKIIFKIFFFF